MVGGSSTSSKSPRSTSPFRSKKGSPSPFSSPAIKNVAGRPASPSSERPEFSKPKENVTVTVRFRPLSAREMKQGNEIAWYADGDCTVRNEVNPNIAYAFDRVFGPATTTRHVYDIAAHHVVSGAMEGINGTIFAYGVTSSGKTHTMHGLQKSPGIIPLAVKDVFEIIQETPGREFLLRVSYLEIYNEVINDLLDPAGQSLRIREDTQGTYIEGIKDEVVLSPAHALSLIATGEAHRHVGSNNFNLLSSRSHTIFTLTIESSPHGQSQGEEDVSLSQLHLIDLAGSESSKIETNGLRRKEGSYINKSLLTLGTVISKLTDGKASHIPYRDSKLTRLLQSSLSGHGRISLICTVTPASGHSEETHNTLKFAHRSKHVEIKASQNKILDEKSLIKKYQKEILSLKQELQTLKHGIPEDTCVNVSTPEDLVSLKLQLEAGQAQLQSSTEEEEQARAALTGRIQRLTKLILVSTRNTPGTTHVPQKSVYTRRHSFGEEELAHLPDRTRENAICCDDSGGGSLDPEVPIDGCVNPTNLHEIVKDYKKSKRKGMLGWFKSRKPELVGGLSPVATDDGQSSTSGSPATASRSSQNRVMASDVKEKQRKLVNRKQGDLPATNLSPEKGQTDEFLSTGIGLSHNNLTGTTITDQLDVLQEQLKLLAGEVAQCTYSLKRLSGEAINSPENSRDEEQIRKLKNEITEKKLHIHQLEQCIKVSLEAAPQSVPRSELSQALAKIATQLSEKTFELEINSVDKRILREQLQMKISENAEMQEAILLLRQQLSTSSDNCSIYPEGQNQSAMLNASALDSNPINLDEKNKGGKDSPLDATTPTSVISLNRFFGQDDSKDCKNATNSNLQISNIENLKQENARLAEEKIGLEIHSQKLAEEASYAKELAAAAAIELQHLTEEVTRLSYQNAELIGELGSTKEVTSGSGCCQPLSDVNKNNNSFADIDASSRKLEYEQLVEYLQNELHTRYQREAMLEAALSEKEQVERELDKQLSEAKRHEEVLESDLENLWVLIENMRKSGIETDDVLSHRIGTSNYRSAEVPVGISSKGSVLSAGSQVSRYLDKISSAGASNLKEIERSKELEKLISRLKGEDLSGLDMATLEELQNVHVEAITKICQAKDLLDSIYTS